MKQISSDAGCPVILSNLRVLGSRLRARPDTQPFSVPVLATYKTLSEAHMSWQELHDLRVTSTGSVVFADDEEDYLVAKLVRRLMVLVDGKRSDPRYQRLFQEAPSKTTDRVADEEQARLVSHIIDTVTKSDDYASLRDLLPSLTAAHAALATAKTAQQSAMQSEEAAWKALQVAEQVARDIYRDTEPKLEILFPGRRRLVDSFYPSNPRKSKKEGAQKAKGEADKAA